MAVYSIIEKSKFEGAHRLDAEYFSPEYLEVERKLNAIKTVTIDNISESVVNFGAYSLCNYIEWRESGVPYLNVENIKDGYIDFEGIKFIDEEVNKILKRSKVEEGQVIITMAGTIGNVAVAHNIPAKVNSNQATAKITLRQDFSPYYLAAFLGSYYGRKQTEREIVSSVQPNIFLWQIKSFKVPVDSQGKEREIGQVYKNGLKAFEQSKSFYSQAEDFLLSELGLKNFKSQEDLTYSVNLSEIKLTNRLDAGYFQPKYDAVIGRIKKHNLKSLAELVTMKKGFEPGSDEYQEEGKVFLRVSNISRAGFTDKDQKCLSSELYQQLKSSFEPKTGDILLTKDATPGIAYVLKESVEGIIASGIMRLKIKEDIDAEYLALCINSLVCQMQVERDAGGSIIVHWKPERIKNLLIPILPKSTQQKITDLVRKSHEARKKAKELLEEAKQKVEEMIEKGS